MINRYQVNILFVDKWHRYPFFKYYDAKIKQEVAVKV